MTILPLFLGADHGGFALKKQIMAWLKTQPLPVQVAIEDVGATRLDPDDDYPQFGAQVAQAVSQRQTDPTQNPPAFGILSCRSGIGMAAIANRFPGVRAAVCHTLDEALLARQHNNANILVLEGDHLSLAGAQEKIPLFLMTPFAGGRHARRVQQIENLAPHTTAPSKKPPKTPGARA